MQGEALDSLALAHGEIKHSTEALNRIVREPQDTWSNLAFIFVAAVLLSPSFSGFRRQSAYALYGLGVGSFLYHASASRFFRNVDVAGMFWVCLYLLACTAAVFRPRWSRLFDRFAKPFAVASFVIAILATYGRNLRVLEFKPLSISFFTVVTVAVSIITLCTVLVRRRARQDLLSMVVIVLFLGVAVVCEEGDRPGHWGCDPDAFIQLHAVWHILGAIGCGLLFHRFAVLSAGTPNQSLEPTVLLVTPHAAHVSRRSKPWLSIKR